MLLSKNMLLSLEELGAVSTTYSEFPLSICLPLPVAPPSPSSVQCQEIHSFLSVWNWQTESSDKIHALEPIRELRTQPHARRRKVFTPRFISVTAQTGCFVVVISEKHSQRGKAIILSEQIYTI